MAKCPCVYEETGCCPRMLKFANDAFQDNVQDLVSIHQQYLDGKLLQGDFLEKIDVCEEKLKLVSDKVITKLLKEHWRQNQ